MKTIYKYRIDSEKMLNHIKSFQGANFINVGYDCDDYLCVWAEIDTNKPKIYFNIFCFGTGQNLTDFNLEKMKYIGTIKDDFYVWHIYYEEEE